jgi:hypothetical protein
MTIAFALEHIPRRMNDIGVGTQYQLHHRHFVLAPNGVLELDASNQYFFQLDEVADVRIESDFGVYDLTSTLVNEMQYEHSGQILITNYTSESKHLRFIHVIPKK